MRHGIVMNLQFFPPGKIWPLRGSCEQGIKEPRFEAGVTDDNPLCLWVGPVQLGDPVSSFV